MVCLATSMPTVIDSSVAFGWPVIAPPCPCELRSNNCSGFQQAAQLARHLLRDGLAGPRDGQATRALPSETSKSKIATDKIQEVVIHDFVDEQLGKVIPYGVFDLSLNEGWVSVGIDHDTAQFAAQAIVRWWQKMGAKRYPRARQLLITADGGGSNGSRCRLWKVALQDLATRLGFPVHVCHFPPGTSKWNKIEHRMFSHITENWRGRPLVSHEVIINLIANTKPGAVYAFAPSSTWANIPRGVAEAELKALNLKQAEFHGDWNYAILPRRRK